MSFPPSSNVCKPRPSSDGAHWANVQASSISTDEISLWNSVPEGRGKLEGEQLEAGGARVALRCPARASEGCQSLRHDLLPPLSASGRALPARSPADRPRAGRERSGAERGGGGGALNEDRSPNRPEAGSGRCEGEGRAARKSEAQPLQLNQFGDKNSACRPCLCSDFLKVSAALERKPAGVRPCLLFKLERGTQ